jgi:hypothetical protein
MKVARPHSGRLTMGNIAPAEQVGARVPAQCLNRRNGMPLSGTLRRTPYASS